MSRVYDCGLEFSIGGAVELDGAQTTGSHFLVRVVADTGGSFCELDG